MLRRLSPSQNQPSRKTWKLVLVWLAVALGGVAYPFLSGRIPEQLLTVFVAILAVLLAKDLTKRFRKP